MSHVDISEDAVTIPEYAVHDADNIKGFFGQYRWLSNFYDKDSRVRYFGRTFQSVEHAYQAAKWPAKDHERFLGITPGQAKRLGRKAPDFDEESWKNYKYPVMFYLVSDKFLNNPEMAKRLIQTDYKHLEETNSWGDTYWGVCKTGENTLGKILMIVRQLLKGHQK